MELFYGVDILAVVVASAALIALGMVWYNPKVLGSIWMHEAGITVEQAKKGNMSKAYATGIAATLCTVLFLDALLSAMGVTDLTDAFTLSFFIWCIAALPIELHRVAWEMKSFTLAALNSAHSLLGLLIAAAILVRWPL